MPSSLRFGINNKKSPQAGRQGFSLIELLVVISIIAVLSVVGIVVYTTVLKNSRDSKRMSDLRFIQSALEQYNSDQGFYPAAGIIDADKGITNLSGRPTPAPLPTTITYLQQIPRDPFQSPSASPPLYYRYTTMPSSCDNSSTYCTNYCLWACLEGLSSSSIPSVCPSSPMNGACISPPPGYNFAITQP